MSGKSLSSCPVDVPVLCVWPGYEHINVTLKKTKSKLCSTCYTFKWCYQRANWRQTDHVANMVPKSPIPIWNQSSPLLNTLFYKHCDPRFQWLLAVCSETPLWLLVALSLFHPPAYDTVSHNVTADLCGDPLHSRRVHNKAHSFFHHTSGFNDGEY